MPVIPSLALSLPGFLALPALSHLFFTHATGSDRTCHALLSQVHACLHQVHDLARLPHRTLVRPFAHHAPPAPPWSADARLDIPEWSGSHHAVLNHFVSCRNVPSLLL